MNILDMLLAPEAPNVLKELPTKQYKVKRLSELFGEEAVLTLKALPYGKVEELKRSSEGVGIQILLAGVVDPDLRDPRLMEKYGGVTPAETVKAMFLPGEIEDISRAVEELCGYRRSTIEEVKKN